jgi:hypothetical protein
MVRVEAVGGRILGLPISFVPDPKRLCLAEGTALSRSTFPELLFGALRVPEVSRGFLVRPVPLGVFALAAVSNHSVSNPSGKCGAVIRWLQGSR